MANDENVISLDARRGERQEQEKPGKKPAKEGGPGAPGTEDRPVSGRLIWLYCSTCNTLEYTEMAMSGGRVHNACGTQVQEAEVELDLRAEYTLAGINLERIRIIENLLEGQRLRYEEYRRRIALAAGRNLEPYAAPEEALGPESVSEVDAFGLLISRFFKEPTTLFPDLKAPDTPREPPSETPPSDPDPDKA